MNSTAKNTLATSLISIGFLVVPAFAHAQCFCSNDLVYSHQNYPYTTMNYDTTRTQIATVPTKIVYDKSDSRYEYFDRPFNYDRVRFSAPPVSSAVATNVTYTNNISQNTQTQTGVARNPTNTVQSQTASVASSIGSNTPTTNASTTPSLPKTGNGGRAKLSKQAK